MISGIGGTILVSNYSPTLFQLSYRRLDKGWLEIVMCPQHIL